MQKNKPPKHSTEKCHFEANALKWLPPQDSKSEGQKQVQQRDNQNNSNEKFSAATQMLNKQCHFSTPKLR